MQLQNFIARAVLLMTNNGIQSWGWSILFTLYIRHCWRNFLCFENPELSDHIAGIIVCVFQCVSNPLFEELLAFASVWVLQNNFSPELMFSVRLCDIVFFWKVFFIYFSLNSLKHHELTGGKILFLFTQIASKSICRVFVKDTRANGWIGYLFTTERDCLFWLKHSNVCLQTSDSPTFHRDFSRCLTKIRGI